MSENADFSDYFKQGMDFLSMSQQQMNDWFEETFVPPGQPPTMAAMSGLMGNTPHLDNLFGMDKKVAAFLEAATALTAANAELQALISRNWLEAYQRFSTGGNGATTAFGDSVDQWFNYANDAMLQLQRTTEFLEVQRKYINASTEYRNRYRELMEVFQEKNNMPTRTEIDDLSRTVYELKRELRSLKRQMSRSAEAIEQGDSDE